MKINNPRSQSRKKIAIISLVALLALSGGYFAYAKSNGVWPFTKDTADKTSGETYINSNAGANTDASVPKSRDNPKSPASNSDTPTTSDEDSSTTSNVPMTITYIQMNSDDIKIGTNIEAVTNTGNCTLSVKNSSGSEVYTEVTGVQALPNSSTCKGFSIPASNVGSGSYAYVVTFTQSGKFGTASKEFVKQ